MCLNSVVERSKFLTEVKTHIPSDSSWKIAFEAFLEAHYSNPDLKFSDLVDHFKLSRTHLSALFKKHVGKPFREKLREIRIAHAKHLISEQSLLTYEVASMCGFHSSKYFCQVFMKVNDMSLTAYRAKVRCESILEKNS
ncbi:MAG: helix-turn-helix transcriptional regulator [Gemmatimonadetes bacterium]|nr:helix-turn-helix transcriptional regulator [Gemmatimonadota bacterium]MYK53884.1 helix-turn-helix transcriptional regulator [Gemmatimonadota bacterium]